MTGPYEPPPEDPDLTEDEAEGIRRAMEEVDDDDLHDFDEVMAELTEARPRL
ncbi:hypothetical protein LVJ94_05505 [Pendulispora rubella]|uniref:Sox C-terminal domain-containing protein n=1 Tax=Pendulispora rubella TaxID=2741070 RepID=A0ABZ2L9S4_9BACT